MAYTSDLPLSALSGEEKLFLERIRDLVTLCDQRGIPRFSAFLDERQQRIALSAGSLPGVTCGFWGGFPDAERKMFYALPDYCSPEDESLYPIRIITAEFPRQYALTHRDFLGALMNLGLRREAIGDILVGEGRAVLFLWETVADLVLSELSKAGRVGLRLTEGRPEELPGSPFLPGDRRNRELHAAGLRGSAADPGEPGNHRPSDSQRPGNRQFRRGGIGVIPDPCRG